MPRIRTIKPDFFSNEQLGQLSAEARLLFIGLWTLADREGRLEDRPIRIKAQLFPYDSWPVDGLLDSLHDAELISRYEAEGKKCIQITNFVKHQYTHPKENSFGLPPLNERSPEKTGNSREKPDMQQTSPVDLHVLSSGFIDSGFQDSGLTHSGFTVPGKKQASESRFSLKDCQKYAESLPNIRAPAAFAKSIWRSGEDDDAVAHFLDHGISRETDKEHSARLARLAAEGH